MELQDKEYDLDEMKTEDIVDIAGQLNEKKAKCEAFLEKAKTVVKARYLEKEIAAEMDGKIGHLRIQEADDYHPIDPKVAYNAMKDAGMEENFPDICTVNLKDSGKKAKVKTLGILHFLPAIVVEKIRIKKRAKALTVYFSMKKE